MKGFPGFSSCELIHDGAHMLVYRLLRNNCESLILKTPRAGQSDPRSIHLLQREYAIGALFQNPAIVRYKSQEILGGKHVLVLEDFGGVRLKTCLTEQGFPLDEFLKWAIQLTKGLAAIHREGVMHKGIRPGTIILNRESGEIKLSDLSSAVRRVQERAPTMFTTGFKEMLHYMAPEQTGRTNRMMDTRSDLYSLGAVFYAMICGTPPYPEDEPKEIIQGHIGREPKSLLEIRENLPGPLWEIIKKLLAREPDSRYQSAEGLHADLENYHKNQGREGHLWLGLSDASDRLHLPSRLYGRTRELAWMEELFERTVRGKSGMVFLSGEAGIGKTRLVHEVYRSIVQARGYHGSGKYHQYQRDTPFSGITESISSLMEQLLSEPAPWIENLRSRLDVELGDLCSVLTGLAPKLRLLLHCQQKAPAEGSLGDRARLIQAIIGFIRTVAEPEHPLILFWDDLQWADPASLKLMAAIAKASIPHLFLIGSFRDHELTSEHPLTGLLEKVDSIAATFPLRLLTEKNQEDFLSDTFKTKGKQIQELAAFLFSKTKGNPFFMSELVKSWHADGLISFNHSTRAWEWSLDRIQSKKISGSVVDFLLGKIAQLPAPCRRLLHMGACIGNSFDLLLAAEATNQPFLQVIQSLEPALEAGLITGMASSYDPCRKSVVYKFLHDRIQQAAYEMDDEDARRRRHLKIGRLLKQQDNYDEFAVLEHLNHAREYITGEEQVMLANLNNTAGMRAQKQAAFHTALHYYEMGCSLLAEDAWTSERDLAMALNRGKVFCAMTIGQVKDYHAQLSFLLGKASNSLEKLDFLLQQLSSGVFLNKDFDFMEVSSTALKLCNLSIPEGEEAWRKQMDTMWEVIEKKQDQGWPFNILDMDEITDPIKQRAILVLSELALQLYLKFRFKELERFTLWGVYLVAVYGRTPAASAIFSYFSLMLALKPCYPEIRNYSLAAERLARFHGNKQMLAITYCVAGLGLVYDRPFRELSELYRDGCRAGMVSGCTIHMSGNLMNQVLVLFTMGKKLPMLKDSAEQASQVIRRAGVMEPQLAEMFYWLAASLQDGENNRLTWENLSDAMKSDMEGLNGYSQFLFLQFAQAFWQGGPDILEKARCAAPYMLRLTGFIYYHDYDVLYALTQIQHNPNPKSRSAISENLERLEKAAACFPPNFSHKLFLVQAELGRIVGKPYSWIRDRYEQAIEEAVREGFLQYQGLACELLARYLLNNERNANGFIYLEAACKAYEQWGATTRITWLQQCFPDLLAHHPQ